MGSARYTVRWNIMKSSNPYPADYLLIMIAFVIKEAFHTVIPDSSTTQAAISFDVHEYIFIPSMTNHNVPVHQSKWHTIIKIFYYYLLAPVSTADGTYRINASLFLT